MYTSVNYYGNPYITLKSYTAASTLSVICLRCQESFQVKPIIHEDKDY